MGYSRKILPVLWPLIALAIVFPTSDALAGYTFSVSASSTDPYVNTAPPAGTLRNLYLWLVCSDEGISVFEAGVTGTQFIGGFTPLNGALNFGTNTWLFMAVPGCPQGSDGHVLGYWQVYDTGGTVCLGPSTENGIIGAVDCDTSTPTQTLDPLVLGFSSDSTTAPCAQGANGCQQEAQAQTAWSLRVEGLTATLEHNDFGSTADFPIDEILVRRRVDLSTHDGYRLSLDIRRETAALSVNDDGSLSTGLNASLVFHPASRVAEQTRSQVRLIGLPGDGRDTAATPLSRPAIRLASPDDRTEHILAWANLGSSRAVLATERNTLFFDVEETTGPVSRIGRSPTQTYPFRTSIAAVSDRMQVVASLASSGRQRRIVVHGFDGQVRFEGHWSGYHYGQLHVTPESEALVFDRNAHGKGPEVVVQQLDGSRSAVVPVANGIRYFSGDGSRLAVVQQGFGRLIFYDFEDPWSPRRLWEYQADHHIVTTAVNHDGSLVACQVLTPPRDDFTVLKRIVVLNGRDGTRRPFQAGDQASESAGLQWEGDYLFAGVQTHPLPVPVHRATTKHVRVFSFRGRQP